MDATRSALPVVIIGGGPIGLAAAAELHLRGQAYLLLERGTPGASVAAWGHVRLFSRWSELISPAACRVLEAAGWLVPNPDRYPTGAEWVREYLAPLAEALGDAILTNTEALSVSRRGRDLLVDAGRDLEPLIVQICRPDGSTERLAARAVIDCSGTWLTPNPLGSEGVPALGEVENAAQIRYRAPDLTDPAIRASYAGRHIAIAGSGHSALQAIDAFASLAAECPGTRVYWLIRRPSETTLYGGGDTDELAERGALGTRAHAAVRAGRVTVIHGFRTVAVTAGTAAPQAESGPGPLTLVSDSGQRLTDIDAVVALTGFRPNLALLGELRLDLHPTLQAPRAIAELVDPNIHSCGSVPAHGAAELAQPEPGLFIAGMKSYGRAPTFLALTGFEQVRSIAAHLAGDDEAASRVELVLPETGVCGGAGLYDDPDAGGAGGCCAPPAAPAPGTGLSIPVGATNLL